MVYMQIAQELLNHGTDNSEYEQHDSYKRKFPSVKPPLYRTATIISTTRTALEVYSNLATSETRRTDSWGTRPWGR